VDCPGFPDRSFGFYEMRGSFGQDFDRLLLVVDGADQVVAVQLVSSKPLTARLDASFVSERWHAYQLRGIAHQDEPAVARGPPGAPAGPHRRDRQRTGGGRGKGDAPAGPRARAGTLLLPEPVVNLILARLEKAS
jgi:hypothetical protein